MAPSRSTSPRFALIASGVKRGRMLRKSELSSVVFSSIFPVRKPLPRGLYGTKPIPSSSFERRQNFLLRIAIPKRVFALHRRDGLDCMRPANRLCSCFGKTEMLHLAGPDQIHHRSRYIFDGDVGINAMLIEQVDNIGLEPPERSFGDLLDVLWPAV